MNEELTKQLTRQLKLLNIWISVFGTLIIISFLIIIFLLFKVVTFVQDTSQKVSDLQQKASQSVDVRSQLCKSDSVGSFLQDKSDVCKTR